ncbi:hypothetical protein BDV09DRAFT_181571 [Aspergillus tetrazonus]
MLTDLEFQSTMVSGLLALNLRDGLERANQSNIWVSDHSLYFYPSKAASAGCVYNSSRTEHPPY